MSELEGFSYAVFAVYVATSIGLDLAGRKLGVANRPVLPLLAVVGAGLWPLLRWLVGDPITADALQQWLDGLTGDLVGHGLVAAGALTAMMAEVQILTRARVAAVTVGEPPAGPFVHRCVAGGRVLQLAGLFLVFPGIVAAAVALAAGGVIAGQRLPKVVLEAPRIASLAKSRPETDR